jgi:hypothetical protein
LETYGEKAKPGCPSDNDDPHLGKTYLSLFSGFCPGDVMTREDRDEKGACYFYWIILPYCPVLCRNEPSLPCCVSWGNGCEGKGNRTEEVHHRSDVVAISIV